jgi:hypothetical protein
VPGFDEAAGAVHEGVLELTFHARRSELHEARQVLGDSLGRQGIDSEHAWEVVAVVNELIAAVRECDVTTPVSLTVATYPLLTSVRLRCDRNVELRDKPFDLRERLLQHFAVAFGRRRRDDGTVDLWAEVARRH